MYSGRIDYELLASYATALKASALESIPYYTVARPRSSPSEGSAWELDPRVDLEEAASVRGEEGSEEEQIILNAQAKESTYW